MNKLWKATKRCKLNEEEKKRVLGMLEKIKVPQAILDKYLDQETLKTLLWLVTGLTATTGVLICIAGIIG